MDRKNGEGIGPSPCVWRALVELRRCGCGSRRRFDEPSDITTVAVLVVRDGLDLPERRAADVLLKRHECAGLLAGASKSKRRHVSHDHRGSVVAVPVGLGQDDVVLLLERSRLDKFVLTLRRNWLVKEKVEDEHLRSGVFRHLLSSAGYLEPGDGTVLGNGWQEVDVSEVLLQDFEADVFTHMFYCCSVCFCLLRLTATQQQDQGGYENP